MANISITLACNRHCAYCFAGATMRAATADTRHMTRERYLSVLALLERSGVPVVRLLGGEPTLHPDLTWMIQRAFARKFRVVLFSNGAMRPSSREALAALAADGNLKVLLNLNRDALDGKQEEATLRATLQQLGSSVMPGFNIDSPAADPGWILPLINTYGLQPRVRLGLAHPGLEPTNRHVKASQYAAVGARIDGFAEVAAHGGVNLELDCGFVPCMFPEGFFRRSNVEGGTIGRRCNPMPDILPDGSLVPCYPLTALRSAPFSGSARLQDVRASMEETLARYKGIGIYPWCQTCHFRQAGTCTATNRSDPPSSSMDLIAIPSRMPVATPWSVDGTPGAHT